MYQPVRLCANLLWFDLVLRLTLPLPTPSPQAPHACHARAYRASLESRSYTPNTATGATARRWDGHWLAGCPAPPSQNRHTAAGDRTAPRCRPGAAVPLRRETSLAGHAGVERPALEPAHIGHSGVCE